ncbi:uncharacterized protein BP01DRAFT_266491, partial [Aspergillus saccharolyticus JOP 1030-1]
QGLLELLPTAVRLWDEVIIDFITSLSVSTYKDVNSQEVYNSIIVIVDYFSKIAHFISTYKILLGEELVILFLREI